MKLLIKIIIIKIKIQLFLMNKNNKISNNKINIYNNYNN